MAEESKPKPAWSQSYFFPEEQFSFLGWGSDKQHLNTAGFSERKTTGFAITLVKSMGPACSVPISFCNHGRGWGHWGYTRSEEMLSVLRPKTCATSGNLRRAHERCCTPWQVSGRGAKPSLQHGDNCWGPGWPLCCGRAAVCVGGLFPAGVAPPRKKKWWGCPGKPWDSFVSQQTR